jgi:hypothetical protein
MVILVRVVGEVMFTRKDPGFNVSCSGNNDGVVNIMLFSKTGLHE